MIWIKRLRHWKNFLYKILKNSGYLLFRYVKIILTDHFIKKNILNSIPQLFHKEENILMKNKSLQNCVYTSFNGLSPSSTTW